MNPGRPLPLSFLVAALGWTWLVTGLVVLAAWSGRPDEAFGDVLLAATSLGPLGWIAWSANRPLVESGVLGALCFAPLLSAAAYAGDAARLPGLLYSLGVMGLLTWGATGAPQRIRIALAASFGLALPLGLWVWADLGQSQGASLAPLAPALTLRDVLTTGLAQAGGWALGLGIAAAGLVGLLRRRQNQPEVTAPAEETQRGALPLAALLLGLTAGGLGLGLAPSMAEERPLLGNHIRPDEPAPLELRPAPSVPSAARSFGHRFLAAPSAAGARLIPVPLAAHLELERREGETWVRVESDLKHYVLQGRDVLVGCVGEEAWRAAGSTLPTDAKRVRLSPDQAPLLAEAGSAFDVVLLSPGQAPRLAGALRAWTAAGGLLVVPEKSDLAGLGPRTVNGELEEVRIGAGRAVAPVSSEGWPALAHALDGQWDERHARRARRLGVREALLLEPDPRPDGIEHLVAALLALALIWSALAALALRAKGPTVAAGAWVVALLAAALLRSLLPTGPAWTSSRQVLEAPSGSLSAARLEVVTTLRLRPDPAHLELVDYAPPLPAFLSEGEAIQASAQLEPASPGRSPSITLPAGRGVLAFRRLDACELPGHVTLTVGPEGIRIENQLEATLSEVRRNNGVLQPAFKHG
ncbi:MAG: hypothetical protein JKY65_03345, partial [Planctomycetes bacterium]|nr:hypothetical protein [Planctomycetota bacterium]